MDSHVHFWDAAHTPQPWMGREHAAIARPFSPSDLSPRMRQEAVDAVVVVQGACLDSDTDYLFDDVSHVAERFPALRIVINHLGKPPMGTSEMSRWEAMLRDVAQHSNVMSKISGLNTTGRNADWSAADWSRSIEVALDSFGQERLMCGSDWPVALLNGDYHRVWHATRKAVEAAAPGCADALLGANAGRIYRLEVPAHDA